MYIFPPSISACAHIISNSTANSCDNLERRARRDAARVGSQVAGVENERHKVNSRVDREVRQVESEGHETTDKMGQIYVRIDVTVREIVRVKRYVDNGDGNETWLHEQHNIDDEMQGKLHAMELCQQLVLDHTALIFGGPL